MPGADLLHRLQRLEKLPPRAVVELDERPEVFGAGHHRQDPHVGHGPPEHLRPPRHPDSRPHAPSSSSTTGPKSSEPDITARTTTSAPALAKNSARRPTSANSSPRRRGSRRRA